jgi:hypothetical protein
MLLANSVLILVFLPNRYKVKWDEGTTTKSCHKDLQPIDVANDRPSANADIIVDPGLDQHVTADNAVLTDEVLFPFPWPPNHSNPNPNCRKMVMKRANLWKEKKTLLQLGKQLQSMERCGSESTAFPTIRGGNAHISICKCGTTL